MATIKQYRPAFFEGFENETKTFSSIDELLNIEFVKNFSQMPEFHQYSISKHSEQKGYEYVLMAEYKDGFEWWVVGYIDDIEPIKELPTWKAKYKTENGN